MDILNKRGKVILTVDADNLRKADLSHANLRKANLRKANLHDASLHCTNLRKADLSYANLSEAKLSYANLSEAKLSYANLSGATLSYANLSGATLSYAILSGVDLSYADLSGADLSYADLSGAVLYGAEGIISFGPIGDERRIGYAYIHDNNVHVRLGCFSGDFNEAIETIREKYGEDSQYEALVRHNVWILASQYVDPNAN